MNLIESNRMSKIKIAYTIDFHMFGTIYFLKKILIQRYYFYIDLNRV